MALGRSVVRVFAALAACAAMACSAHKDASLPLLQPAANLRQARPNWNFAPPLGVTLPDEAVVRVVSDGATCSGTLVSDDLVLTAHHCVVDRDDQGHVIEHDLLPGDLEVELGGDYLPWGHVGVRAIVAPPCGYNGGNGDIAVMVLSRKLVGLPVMVPRLDESPRVGELIDPVGFGRCPLSTDGIHRIRRSGGAIQMVGATAVFAATSICPGDSGGPARSRTNGEVIGVVSAGVMDGSDQTRDPSIFTRLDVWRAALGMARMIANGASPAELPPLSGCD